MPSELAPFLALHVPLWHLVQLASVEAPVKLLQVPGEHSMQVCADEAPRTWLHVPTGHREQTSLLVAPRSVDQVPGSQAAHSRSEANPSEPPQRPAEQAWQEPCVGEPRCELHVPWGHLVQVASETAPAALLHVPGLQRVHSEEPSLLQVPAPQSTQVWDLGAKPMPAGQPATSVPARAAAPSSASRMAAIGSKGCAGSGGEVLCRLWSC